jgi:hypothetical protein
MSGNHDGANLTGLNRIYGEIQARMLARANAAFLRYVKSVEQGQVQEANSDLAITLIGVTRHELADRDLSGYLSPEGKEQLRSLVLEHQSTPAYARASVGALAHQLEAMRKQGVEGKE